MVWFFMNGLLRKIYPLMIFFQKVLLPSFCAVKCRITSGLPHSKYELLILLCKLRTSVWVNSKYIWVPNTMMFDAYLVDLLAFKKVETHRLTDRLADIWVSWAAFAAENWLLIACIESIKQSFNQVLTKF